MKFIRSFNEMPIRMIRRANTTYYSGYDVATALQLENKRRSVNEAVILENGSIMEVEWEGEKVIFISDEYVICLAWKSSDWSITAKFIKWLIEIAGVSSNFVPVEVDQKEGNDKTYFATTQIAARYGLSAIQLNELLHTQQIQYKVNGQWVLYSKYQDLNLTKVIKAKKRGKNEYVLHTYWTTQGLEFIEKVLSRLGYERQGEQMKLF